LARKLGIRPGHRVGIFGAPTSFPALLEPLPAGVSLVRAPRRLCEVTVSFAKSRDDLAARSDLARRVLPADGGLWLAWPKQSSGVLTDLSFLVAQEIGLEAGLVDNKVCAIDTTWSGVRFVVPLAARPGWS
jgi:hypothetical protein